MKFMYFIEGTFEILRNCTIQWTENSTHGKIFPLIFPRNCYPPVPLKLLNSFPLLVHSICREFHDWRWNKRWKKEPEILFILSQIWMIIFPFSPFSSPYAPFIHSFTSMLDKISTGCSDYLNRLFRLCTLPTSAFYQRRGDVAKQK